MLACRTWLAIGLTASAVGCGASARSAARDPFIGDWKLDPARSEVADLMKVQAVNGNTYAFDFGGGAETIVADGTDQPGTAGTTLAATIEGPDAWRIVRKQAGRTIVDARWKLAQDGNTLSDDFTQFADDGQVSVHAMYLYHRTAAGPGFTGAWEGTIGMPSSQTATLQIRPYDGDGLSFIYPSARLTRNLRFDGKDYPVVGPGAGDGATASARWVDDHTLALVDKIKGEIKRTYQLELSRDRKTVTQTAHPVGQHGATIFVFERK